MTIDESIAREREVAEIHRDDIVPKEDYHNMPWIDMENELNMRSAEEHEQLAEWLEELKAYREKKCNKSVYLASKSVDKIDAVNKGYTDGYNKALDDAKSVILQTVDNEILVDTLHLRLEQLKEQICQ